MLGVEHYYHYYGDYYEEVIVVVLNTINDWNCLCCLDNYDVKTFGLIIERICTQLYITSDIPKKNLTYTGSTFLDFLVSLTFERYQTNIVSMIFSWLSAIGICFIFILSKLLVYFDHCHSYSISWATFLLAQCSILFFCICDRCLLSNFNLASLAFSLASLSNSLQSVHTERSAFWLFDIFPDISFFQGEFEIWFPYGIWRFRFSFLKAGELIYWTFENHQIFLWNPC